MDPLLLEIRQLYGYELFFVERILSGFLSENYTLTDGTKKYFLKKHRHTDLKQVEGVCLAEQFFAEGGVPVILPLTTHSGTYFFEQAGSFYSLYPFIEGRHIERGTLSEQAAVSLGTTLGVLHWRGRESRLPILEHFNAHDKEKFLTKAAAIEAEIAKKRSLSEFDALARISLELKKRYVLANTTPYEQLSLKSDTLIHGDYFCDNVFFNTQDHVSHVFDFEKTQYAPASYEMFRSLLVSFFSIPIEENLVHAKKYVNAYLAENPLSKEVVKDGLTAAFLKQIHSLWIEEEHYLKNSTRPDELLPSQYALNEYYISNQKKIENFLLSR